ncbi:hypothetical protein LTR08_000858 [Meristemomyces frigidus]|nr:hypothetical protein LTR08_000858 [Meristemomyces frigidus]
MFAFSITSFIAAASTVYLIFTYFRAYRRLRAFKGPLLASFSEVWLFKESIYKRMHTGQREALSKYGSPARIGPNLLVTDDPELLRHMSAPRSNWVRGNWYEDYSFGGTTPNIFSETNEKKHARLRTKLGPAYSGKGVDNLESSIVAQILKMRGLLTREYASKGKAVDMIRLSEFFTLDVLSEIAFGQAFGYLDANEDLYDYITTGDAFIPIFELTNNHTWLRKIIWSPWVAALLAPKETDKVGQGRIISIAHQAVAERYKLAEAGKEPKADMLGSFIHHGLSQRESQSEAHIQILAGSESTSTVFRMTMLYIVTNPRIYHALQLEIDAAIAAGSISHVITDVEARQLPYLQAVVWEGLRKTPPLFGLQPKVAPPGGETVNGVFFPGGTQVAICDAALTHRQDIFGEDAEIFRPERWLEADETTRSKYLSTVELIFGSGRFGCLGRNIGLLELNKVFVELLRHFDWAIVNPAKPMSRNVANGVWLQQGMNMVVTERKQS